MSLPPAAIIPPSDPSWTPPPPPRAGGWALLALVLSLVTTLAAAAIAGLVVTLSTSGATSGATSGQTDAGQQADAGALVTVLLVAGVPVLAAILSVLTLLPTLRACRGVLLLRRQGGAVDLPTARARAAAAREAAWTGLGRAVAVLTLLAVVYFCAANDGAVATTFFSVGMIAGSIGPITRAFGGNILIFLVAEALVLVWGLVVALARMAPGPAGAPVRWLATVYVDAFRALPSIITIYLIGFGLPMTDLPPFTSLSPMVLAILALTLTYGAYVGEVYKAGLDSIHPSQSAAALSLGLTRLQALRFVILPQAVRRVVPALLNDFISLQKDSALVSVIGVIDAFNQSKILSSNHFNLAPVTGVALLFILITIPQTRLADRLMAADQRRQRAGG